MDSVGSELATAVPASTDLAEQTTTRASSAARRRAVASPMPLDDPVTMATRPARSSIGGQRRGRPRLRFSAAGRRPRMSEWNFFDYASKDNLIRTVREQSEAMLALASAPGVWEAPTASGHWQV